MKKVVILLIALFTLTGCSSNSISLEKEKYDSYIELLTASQDSNDLPFDVEVYLDKIVDNEVMYRLIIDNPKIALRDIETLVIHDKYTEDIFPSSGIFDTKYSLIPNTVNESSNYAKGIILIGYIPYDDDIKNLDVTFKLIFKYIDDDFKENIIIYSTKK